MEKEVQNKDNNNSSNNQLSVNENVDKSLQQNKKNKISLTLFIFSVLTFVVGLILIVFYANAVFQHLISTEENKLGTTFSLIIFFTYFGVPGFILAVSSTILNCLSVFLYKNKQPIKIIFMVMSILLVVIAIVFYILMRLPAN